jgi:lipopolysaccharide export system protein LptC
MRIVVVILSIILIVMIVAFFTISPNTVSSVETNPESPAESNG